MCEGRTHALIAMDTTLVAAGATVPFLGLGLPAAGGALATLAVLAYGAGPLPDIDLPRSAVSRSMGFLTGWFHWLVVRIAGPHRHGTHSLTGAAAFTAAIELGVIFRHDLFGWLWLGFFLSVIISSGLSVMSVSLPHAGKTLRLAGHHRDIVAMALAALMIWTGWGLAWAAVAVAIGTLTHIASDSCTEMPCPWFWPLSMRKFSLVWPKLLRFREGGVFENAYLWKILVVGAVYLVLVRTGVGLPGSHFLDTW